MWSDSDCDARRSTAGAARGGPLPWALALALAVALAHASAGAVSPTAWRAASSPSAPAKPLQKLLALLEPKELAPDGGPRMPDFITPCRQSDPHLNACLRASFGTFLRGAASGLPAIGLPPLDPMEIPFMDLSGTAPGNITLSLVLRGVNIRGLSKSNVLTFRANLEEQKFEMMSRVPWLHADGNFEASGSVLTFPLSGRGAFSVNMSEVSASLIIYYKKQPLFLGSPDHFQIDHYECDMAPVDVAFHFGDNLDGDNELGEAMNEFLNSNSLEVFGDARERVTRQLGRALLAAAASVLEAFPADRLLPP